MARHQFERARPAASRLLSSAAAACIATVISFGTPAAAGGSITLKDVLAAAKSANGLEEEVSKSLEESKTGEGDVVCSATRLGRHFDQLGGERIAPYECDIGGRTLEVDAQVKMLDAEGRELEVSDPETPAKAAEVKEEGFTWRWREKSAE